MALGTARIRSRQGTGDLAAIDPGALAVTHKIALPDLPRRLRTRTRLT